MPIIDTTKEAIAKWDMHVKTVMEKANKASNDLSRKPSKEDMALEALIKIMVCICQSGTTINESAIDYANDALNANGWGIGVNDYGMCRPVKIDAQTLNHTSN